MIFSNPNSSSTGKRRKPQLILHRCRMELSREKQKGRKAKLGYYIVDIVACVGLQADRLATVFFHHDSEIQEGWTSVNDKSSWTSVLGHHKLQSMICPHRCICIEEMKLYTRILCAKYIHLKPLSPQPSFTSSLPSHFSFHILSCSHPHHSPSCLQTLTIPLITEHTRAPSHTNTRTRVPLPPTLSPLRHRISRLRRRRRCRRGS